MERDISIAGEIIIFPGFPDFRVDRTKGGKPITGSPAQFRKMDLLVSLVKN